MKKNLTFYLRDVVEETKNFKDLTEWFRYIIEEMIIDYKNGYNISQKYLGSDFVLDDADALKKVKNSFSDHSLLPGLFDIQSKMMANSYLFYLQLEKEKRAKKWNLAKRSRINHKIKLLGEGLITNSGKVAIAKACLAPEMSVEEFMQKFTIFVVRFEI